ncbi:MAG: hypothetical protein C4547_08965 [Phycisphaerales bacterium]|nr:MAG: hypothetical protein C4547_08965 [Phycisphaerales bacterium]
MIDGAPSLLGQWVIAVPVGLVALLLILALVWFGWLGLASLWGTVCWTFSGESGNLSVEGFRTRGARQRRTLEVHRVISHVGLAIRVNLPLAPALRSAAQNESGRVRIMLHDLARYLEAGGGLAGGFEDAVPGCPPLVLTLLRRGEASGQLTAAVDDIERMFTDQVLEPLESPRTAVWLALITVLFACGVVGGSLFWIMPKFRDIFDDFEVEMPAITASLVTVFPSFLFGLVALGGFSLVVAAVLSFAGLARPGSRPGWIASAVAGLRWLLPATRRIDYGGGMALVARHLAIILGTGQPLDRIRGLATLLSPGNHLWPRVAAFEQALRDGRAPDEAARDARLGTVMVSALMMIERGEPADAVLGHAAEYYQAIARRWRSALAAVIEPASTLLAAGVVFYVLCAMFLPLVALIEGVLETMG